MGTESADLDGDGAALAVVIAARNEADRIAATVAAVRGAFPAAAIWVADDASEDGTAERALAAGARVVSRGRPHGKGGNATAACEAALGAVGAGASAGDAAPGGDAVAAAAGPAVVLLCDGDLGASAGRLGPLVAAVEAGECELAVAAFSRRVGGGFGLALGFAHWAILSLCGAETTAPISGQRALRVDALRACLPFATGFGMEIGISVDAVRGGYRLREYEIDLEHRATGRTAAGFAHRAAQLRDFARVYASRMGGRGKRAENAAGPPGATA